MDRAKRANHEWTRMNANTKLEDGFFELGFVH
jgi:hypothetical protein